MANDFTLSIDEHSTIGIDVQSSAMEMVSEKIHRKPAKGGATNFLFIQAAVEEMDVRDCRQWRDA